MGINLLSSILLGSALGKAISTFLVNKLGLNLFKNPNIPALSQELASGKTFDFIDFVLTIVFTVSVFLVLQFLTKGKNKLIGIAALIFNIIMFLQINFASYNLNYVLVFFVSFYLFLLILSKSRLAVVNKIGDEELLLIANGLLVGFYLLLLTNTFTTTILPLLALFITPVIYLIFDRFRGLFKSHAHLLLLLSVFISSNVLYLLAIGAIAFVLAIVIKDSRNTKFVSRIIYPVGFIFLILYNPLYFIGHFDSVEEGFWLGWLSGLRDGKTLYKDIAAYHPPLVLWALDLFQKTVGYSIEHTRLLLHLLQIAGLTMYFFLIKSLLKKRLSIIVVMLLAMSLTAIMVRNNVEIRLGVGLFALIFLTNPFISGIIAAISVFTSVEVGIATIVTSLITIIIFKTNRLINIKLYFGGLIVGALPVLSILLITGGLVPAVSQIGFYSNAFSEGYFNLPIERPVTSAFIHWHLINQYISAYPFLWELARGGVIGALIVVFVKFKLKVTEPRTHLAIALALFGIIIFRSALGRSDFYHLLFPLLVALPLIFFSLEELNNKYLVPVFSFLLILVFARNIVNASFIESKLYSLQTYGKAIGEQEKLLTENQLEIVSYIKQNTSANQSIFVYPWNPEIYFLSERPNSTKHYTPYAFFSESYQYEMISELENNKPVIIYNPEMIFGNLSPDSLPIVNKYIQDYYEDVASTGEFAILKAK